MGQLRIAVLFQRATNDSLQTMNSDNRSTEKTWGQSRLVLGCRDRNVTPLLTLTVHYVSHQALLVVQAVPPQPSVCVWHHANVVWHLAAVNSKKSKLYRQPQFEELSREIICYLTGTVNDLLSIFFYYLQSVGTSKQIVRPPYLLSHFLSIAGCRIWDHTDFMMPCCYSVWLKKES